MNFRHALGLALVILLMVAAAALLVLAIDVFAVLFLAIIFGVFLTGLSHTVTEKTPLPYGLSLAAVVTLLLLLAIGTVALFGVRVQSQLARAETRFQQGVERLRTFAEEQPTLQSILSTTPLTDQLLNDPQGRENDEQTNAEERESQRADEQRQADSTRSAIRGRLIGWITSFARTTFGFAINVLIIFFVGLYLAARPTMYVDGVASLFPPAKRTRVKEVLQREYQVMWNWSIGRLFTMLITGTLTGLVLWLIGVPMPWMLGVLTGLLVFIPNLGAALALAIAVIFAMTESTSLALWVIPSYLAIQLIESYAITPIIQQHQTSMPPAALLSLQAILGVVIGLLGAMVAAPLVAATKTLVEEVYIRDYLENRRP